MNSSSILTSTTSYYIARAPWHDEYMNWRGLEAMEELLAPFIERIEPLVRGRDVLEIACGTGNWTQVLAKRVKSVTATDIADSALDIAREKCRNIDNVNILKADAYNLQAVEGSFDAAFAADWWSHMPKRMIPAFLEGLRGKLKSGSPVIFIDIGFQDIFARETVRYDDEGNRISLRTIPDGREFEVIKNFLTEMELREALEGFGEDIEYWEHDELKRWMVSCRI